jgi:hypothetical protein
MDFRLRFKFFAMLDDATFLMISVFYTEAKTHLHTYIDLKHTYMDIYHLAHISQIKERWSVYIAFTCSYIHHVKHCLNPLAQGKLVKTATRYVY